MRTQRHSLPISFAQGFGFLVLALMIASGSCRFNRVKAQVVLGKNPCSEESLREFWGDNWHFGYMVNGCWMYEPLAKPGAPAPFRPRIVAGGR